MRRLTRVALSIAIVAFAGLLAACGDEATGPQQPHSAQLATLPGGAEVVKGQIGPGAFYGLYLPPNWNGDLVLYAHGYAPNTVPLYQMPDVPSASCTGPTRTGLSCVVEMRDSLLALGYGFAWTSYSENGMAVKDATIRTAQLIGLFSDNFGHPKRVYLWSHSLGGAIIMHMVEQNPRRYAGALPVCGIIGGLDYQLSYYYNVRVLFDYFYPGVIPGTPDDPQGMSAAAITSAINANPALAMDLANVDQVNIPYNTLAELIQSIVFAMTFQTAPWFTGELATRTHDRLFFDNSTVRYTGSSDDDALNAGVARFEGPPDAANLVDQWYEPVGNLKVPVLSLNMTRDPVVPVLHQIEYGSIAADGGGSSMYLARTVDRFGHCVSTVPEELQAFRDLVNWAKTGVKPAP